MQAYLVHADDLCFTFNKHFLPFVYLVAAVSRHFRRRFDGHKGDASAVEEGGVGRIIEGIDELLSLNDSNLVHSE